MDLRQFGRKIRITGSAVETNATRLVRRVALSVDRDLVLSTPVDEGRARSNWQVNLGSAADGVREPFSPGEDGSTGAANAQAALAKAEQDLVKLPNGTEVHITNNLPYIGRLNEGWSAQAPEGFVETAVLTGIASIKDARLTVTPR